MSANRDKIVSKDRHVLAFRLTTAPLTSPLPEAKALSPVFVRMFSCCIGVYASSGRAHVFLEIQQ